MDRYKSLMVHLDRGAQCDERVRLACACAHRFGATLAGVYLGPPSALPASLAELVPAEIVSTGLKRLAEAQERTEQSFREAATARGLVAELAAPAGSPFAAAIAYARGVDLAIFGQPQPDESDQHFSRRLIDSVVMSSGRPALVVPYPGLFERVGERVVVAWSNTRESARAIADALPFLLAATSVDVIQVNLPNEDPVLDAQSNEQLRMYFRRNGIAIKIHDDHTEDIKVGEYLLSRVADLGADLIVMGGHGHTRVSEFLLGSVTRTLLKAMTVPVLMSH
jgi:nucleotide-binding universal stress UspA family protein